MTMNKAIPLLLAAIAIHSSTSVEYGVDCSWAQHSTDFKCGNLLGNREQLYQDYMAGCRAYYGEEAFHACDEAEESRIFDNRERVQHVYNFSEHGYHKTQVPNDAWNILYDYWLTFKDEHRTKEVFEGGGNVVNHWDVPTYMVNLFERGEASDIVVEAVYEMLRHELEAWTGLEQRPVSLYGIRVYERGAILASHVDRYPLVTSAIINVDQELEEPWPLE